MKLALIGLFSLLLLGCGKKEEFPKEFVGTWTFDVESLYKDIEERNLSMEEEKALKYSFGDIEKNQTCTVTEGGIFRYPQLPKGVHIQLTLLSHTEEGYLFKEQNSMNSAVAEYSLNRIEDGTWVSILVSEDLKPIHPDLPNTYWKYGTNKSAHTNPLLAE